MQTVIGFHNPDEEYGFLSNWYLSEFIVDDIRFTSMEQYMMYAKAKVFQDEVSAEKILATENVGEIKALGRGVKNYQDVIWNGVRQVAVYEGLMEKFAQNDTLKKLLLETNDAILAECAVKDIIWGIGCSMQDEARFTMTKWKGQNLLGFTLMRVRDKLKNNA